MILQNFLCLLRCVPLQKKDCALRDVSPVTYAWSHGRPRIRCAASKLVQMPSLLSRFPPDTSDFSGPRRTHVVNELCPLQAFVVMVALLTSQQ